ncbi:DUF2316 family protein [Kitasatospora sp. NA04385]|uniref:DUF2316 family protein n=1 Tax=Kitasatospora sp. NA04385 TaxID=2742135 RepID=UPI00158FFABF|nr:DUF2316 family protein [Kitasatospora sp. NA04385]QKW23239.1 DUF2316 family protein [Kitasatospora sp. NA04385]
MSLNAEERARTAAELRANLELTGVDAERAGAELGFGGGQLAQVLGVAGADPEDVWLLRDHLEDLVRAAGREPVPYTVLTEEARAAAERWFPLRKAPRRA